MRQIIDEEARATVREAGHLEDAEDMRQSAWVAVTEARERIDAASPQGAYIRKVVRYSMQRYIKALRRDALGHRE